MLLAKSTDAEPMETEVGLCSWLVEKTAEQDPVARWSSQAKKCQCSSWEWWERGAETGPWQNRTLLKSDLLVIKKILTPASPPHINLQVANFQRCECVFHQCQASVKLQFAFCLLLLTIHQLYHLLPPLPPPVSNSSCLFTWCQPPYALDCTTALLKVLYYKTKNVFIFVFLCIICVKSIVNLLQYSTI